MPEIREAVCDEWKHDRKGEPGTIVPAELQASQAFTDSQVHLQHKINPT